MVCAPKVGGTERAYAFRRQLVKELQSSSKRLEDIRNSTVASFISSSFPGVRRRSS